MSLAKRSVTSATWTIAASAVTVIISLGRAIWLARLLPVEVFGIYAGASSIIRLSVVLPDFGMGGAFIHRTAETQDEGETARIHFTLKLIFTLAWMAVMGIGAAFFAEGPARLALIVLTFSIGGLQLTQTPGLILNRRVVFRRLAVLDILDTIFTSAAALGLAWMGAGLWALLATDIVTFSLRVLAFYIWKPVWRPRLAWSKNVVRYFLRFGSRNFLADILLRALDRVDDLWTLFFLGDIPMGFYSRAYTFATYPRQILAMPINNVAGGTYAELKENRLGLSQAFFRTNAFLVRTGFLLAGVIALVAPEFILIALGTKWLPMLDAFRLMLVFTMLDPIKVTVASLYIAVGQPELVVRARGFQLVVLVVFLFLLGPPFGITGVAIAVDIMLVVGIGLLLWMARAYVDFSPRRLFLVPGVALVLGILLARGSLFIPGILGSPWRTGAVKIALFVPCYTAVLFFLERQETMKMFSTLLRLRK